ncbi:MAG: hypothetical protein HKN68_09855, partial [Saprospiraceae bacterium]|nr:hypothetical protein [Saprospiraceae bacterium]
MILRAFTIVFILLAGISIQGQSPIIPERGISYDIIDRLDILYGSSIFTSNGNFRRHEAYQLASDLFYNEQKLKPLDRWDLQYLIDDNNEFFTKSLQDASSFSLKYIDSTRLFYSGTQTEGTSSGIQPSERKPFLKHFYKTQANFFEVETGDFILKVNP